MKTSNHRAAIAAAAFSFGLTAGFSGLFFMNITRAEQRILHLLAQGGRIEIVKDEKGRAEAAHCYTRDNWRFAGFGIDLFRRLKRRKAVASRGGGAYHITRRGLELVRSRPDNR